MSSVILNLPDDLQKRAAVQAAAAGMSLEQYVATVLAARIGAQAEVERFFAARAARVVPGQARAILARMGQGNPPWAGDEVEDAPPG